jgi:hypothetical protein
VRKRKALVFSTAGAETLDDEKVREILEPGRADRDGRIVESLGGHKKRRRKFSL